MAAERRQAGRGGAGPAGGAGGRCPAPPARTPRQDSCTGSAPFPRHLRSTEDPSEIRATPGEIVVEMNMLNPTNTEVAHPVVLIFLIKLMNEETKLLAVVCNFLLQIFFGI